MADQRNQFACLTVLDRTTAAKKYVCCVRLALIFALLTSQTVEVLCALQALRVGHAVVWTTVPEDSGPQNTHKNTFSMRRCHSVANTFQSITVGVVLSRKRFVCCVNPFESRPLSQMHCVMAYPPMLLIMSWLIAYTSERVPILCTGTIRCYCMTRAMWEIY